ncbi:MAG TPA: LysR family transcriptional regulator [Jatrophihabitans sp.]|nr:LysR family transcriptional regulator [Jatrophihabitans sp.]
MAELPTVTQLRYFLASVEHGSFAAAADAMYIAAPSLSEQIKRLETRLGVVLFTRTNRALQLTDAGRLLLPQAERVLANVGELVDAVRDIRSLAGGTVSFGTFSSAHLYLLPALIAQFHREHPNVQIKVLGLNSAEVADAVRTGALEAGLVQLPIDDQGLWVGPPVLRDAVVYVSVDVDRVARPATIDQLASVPLILSEARWAREDPLRRTLTERAQQAGVVLEPISEVEFQTAAVEIAAHGVGDSLVSYLVTRWRGFPAELRWAPLDPPYVEQFAFITRSSRVLSPATRAFMAAARQHISALQATADTRTTA